MFLQKFHTVCCVSILFTAILFLIVNLSQARSWDDMDFPKAMWSCPSTYYDWYHVSKPPTPISPEDFENLDELGINMLIVHSSIYNNDEKVQSPLIAEWNTPELAVLLCLWQSGYYKPGYSNVYQPAYYREAIGYEKWTGDFYGRLKAIEYPYGPGQPDFYVTHPIFKGNGSLLQSDQETFLTSGTDAGGNGDFFLRPVYFDEPDPRVGHFILKAHSSHSVEQYECNPNIPLLEVKIWESLRGDPGESFTGAKQWVFKFDDNDPTLELTTSPGNFDLSGYAELDPSMDDMQYRKKANEDDLVQYNIEFYLGKVYEPGSNLQTVEEVDVFIDWFGIYDEKGWTIVRSKSDPNVIPDGDYPTYAELEDHVTTEFLPDVYGSHTNPLEPEYILGWYRDDISNHAIYPMVNVDEIISDYDPGSYETLHYYPIQGWEEVSWASDQLGDYFNLVGDVRDVDWLVTWVYPIRGEEGHVLQTDLSYYIENNLKYYLREINENNPDTKFCNVIQCHKFINPDGSLQLRNPYNEEEILVQGYLTLAYGARGIGYSQYHHDYQPDNLNEQRSWGIYKLNVGGTAWIPDTCGNEVDLKEDAVRKLNEDIDILAACLNNMKVSMDGLGEARGGCYGYTHPNGYDPVPTNLSYISNIIPEEGYAAEVTEFDIISGCSDSIPPGNYFMVVNRDTGSIKEITIETNIDEGTENGRYAAEDMSTHRIYTEDPTADPTPFLDIVATFPAGCGKLFRIFFLQEGDSVRWQGEVRIKGELTIPDDMFDDPYVDEMYLIIEPGTSIKMYNDGDELGGIIVKDDAYLRIGDTGDEEVVFERGYHSKYEQQADEPWGGIYFKGTEMNPIDVYYSYVENCSIKDASCGIRIENTDVSSLNVEECTFTDCDTGIYCYDAVELDISYSDFINNSDFGILADDGCEINADSLEFSFSNCAGSIFIKTTDDCELSMNNCVCASTQGNPTQRGIEATESDVEIDSSVFVYCTQGIYFEGDSESRTNTLDITDTGIWGRGNSIGYGVSAKNAIIDISGIYDYGDYTVKYCGSGIRCENSEGTISDIYIHNVGSSGTQTCLKVYNTTESNITVINSRFSGEGDGLNATITNNDTLTIDDCVFLGNSANIGLDVTGSGSGLFALRGHLSDSNYTIKGYDTGLYCEDIKLVVDEYKDEDDTTSCIIMENDVFGCELYDLASGSVIRNSIIDTCGHNASSGIRGGVLLDGSSPFIRSNYITNNKGYAIIALDNSDPLVGGSLNGSGNEFKDNITYSGSDYSAIIFEDEGSESSLDSKHNNFYRGDLTYFIANDDQGIYADRDVEYNYWGSTKGPSASQLYPSLATAWDWDPYADEPYDIGDIQQQMMGNPSGGDLEAAAILEEEGEYEEALEIYRGIVDSTDNSVEKQIALRRILSTSYSGSLELDTLEAYFESFIPSGPSLTPTNIDSQLIKTIERLTAKLEEYSNEYLFAVLDYEAMLDSNPTLGDSVYAVIRAGKVYLKMSESGQSFQSQIIPNPPQMPWLQQDSLETFRELRMELINQLHGGNSLAGGGLDGQLGLLPKVFALHQNYPNPFNSETIIKYDLPEPSEVSIEVYNIMGQLVAILVDGIQQAGYRQVKWRGTFADYGAPIASGIYIYWIHAEGRHTGEKFTNCKKLLMLK